MKENEIETTMGYFKLLPEGISVFRYKDGSVETLETAKEDIAAMLKLVGQLAPVPHLVDLTGMKSQTRDSRKYYAESEEVVKVVKKLALLIKNPVARVLGNVYIGINKTVYPTKLFTSEEEAMKWLRE